MLGQKYLRLRNAPHLWRGPKPGDAVPRQPSQAWRGWGEQGVHVINIKSLSATNRRRILYIFDPYTQEHNIHRTPRRSGGLCKGVLGGAVPLPAPPVPPPPGPEGAVPTAHQSPKVPSSWRASFQPRVDGVVPPCRARPAALGERMERRREGRCQGLSRKPTKCLGSPDPRSEARP